MEMEAVQNLVNHQYNLSASAWRVWPAVEIVLTMVRAAASWVISSWSQVEKNACRKPRLGVECWMIEEPAAAPSREVEVASLRSLLQDIAITARIAQLSIERNSRDGMNPEEALVLTKEREEERRKREGQERGQEIIIVLTFWI